MLIKIKNALALLFIMVSTMAKDTLCDSSLFTPQEAWKWGMLSSVCVAVCGLAVSAIISFFLRNQSKVVTKIITVLIIFAAGALLGDAIIHLVGDAWGPILPEDGESEMPEQPDPRILSCICICSFILFLLIERSLHLLGIEHSHGVGSDCSGHEGEKKGAHNHEGHNHEGHNHGDHNHAEHNHQGHSHDHKGHKHDKDPENGECVEMVQVEMSQVQIEQNHIEGYENKMTSPKSEIKVGNILQSTDMQVIANTSPLSDPQGQKSPSAQAFKPKKVYIGTWKKKKSEGWMSMVADFSHVILDGLGIGITFASGNKSLAISTFVAVLAHEIPSRTGRTAILLHADFTPAQTVLCNGVANAAAIIGAVIGLAAGQVSEVLNKYLVSFVVGNFLYISLMDMMPYMKDGKDNKIFLYQLIAFVAGIGCMYLVLLAEDE